MVEVRPAKSSGSLVQPGGCKISGVAAFAEVVGQGLFVWRKLRDNLGTIIGAGIDSVYVPALRAPIQVILAVRLLAMAEELDPDQQHTVTNRVRDPSAEVVNEISGEFSVGGDLARPEWLAGIIVPMVVEFEASEEGTYTIELIVDDAPPGTQPIHIARGLPA